MPMVTLKPSQYGRRSRALLLGLAALLVAATSFVFLGQLVTPTQSFNGALQNTFPPVGQLSEWTVRDLPVAESAEMQRAVGELLNFDQAAYARYHRGPVEVSLYVAYWSPGRMSHRLIAVHTPDVCWVSAGWERVEGYQTQLMTRGVQFGDQRLYKGATLDSAKALDLLAVDRLPWEYREFRLADRTEYVVFLHLVGGRALGYGVEGGAPWYSVIGDLFERGFRQREEQFFVRISGNRPLPEILATEPVRLFLQQFEREVLGNYQLSSNRRS
jgi:hypothetical protein